jgi:hypothetical protein
MYTYARENYSHINRYKVMLFSGRWMELRIIMLSERSQAQETKYQVILLIYVM